MFVRLVLPGFLVMFLNRQSQAVVTVSFDGEYKKCGNGLDMISMDLSKLDILQMDNENITINGAFTFIKEFGSPLSVHVHSKRLVSGNWIPALNRVIPNFCSVINAPNEMWSSVVSIMAQQNCPFEAGHTETFDNANIGNGAKILKIPPQMLGQWKLFLEIGAVRDGKSEKECAMADVLLEDV